MSTRSIELAQSIGRPIASAQSVAGGTTALLARLLLPLSGAALAGLLSVRGRDISPVGATAYLVGSMALGVVAMYLLCFRSSWVARTLGRAQRWELPVAVILTLVAVPTLVRIAIPRFRAVAGFALERAGVALPAAEAGTAAAWLFGGIGAVAFYIFARGFLHETRTVVGRLRVRLKLWERLYLLGFLVTMTFLIVQAFRVTEAFYAPHWNGALVPYDVLYTSDSGDLIDTNAYLIPTATENDIRQPLFGVFAAPVGLAGVVFSWLFSGVPHAAILGMALAQLLLLAGCGVLLSRHAGGSDFQRAAYLGLFTLSYPALLFSFVMEQYVVAVFWLVLLLCLSRRGGKGAAFAYLGATGSLVISSLFLPLVARWHAPGQRAGFLLRLLAAFVSIGIFSGQLGLLVVLKAKVIGLLAFAARSTTLGDRLLQYLVFVQSCFYAPPGRVVTLPSGAPSFQLETPGEPGAFGIVLLLLAAVGWVRSRHVPFARTAGLWCLCSFVLFVVVGWGAGENGLVLYSLYFGWAFLYLVLQAAGGVTERLGPGRWVALAIVMLLLATLNARGLAAVMQFGTEYYPARLVLSPTPM